MLRCKRSLRSQLLTRPACACAQDISEWTTPSKSRRNNERKEASAPIDCSNGYGALIGAGGDEGIVGGADTGKAPSKATRGSTPSATNSVLAACMCSFRPLLAAHSQSRAPVQGATVIKPKTVKPETVKPKTVKPKTVKPKTVKPVTPEGSVSAFGWLSWPKLCWHNVLCTVFICLIAASASGGAFAYFSHGSDSLLSGSFVLAMRSLSPLVPLSFAHAVTASQWGIILDCGSSGTRARVFSWPEKGWSITEADVELEIEPGISSFANNPEALTAYLAPLLDQARLAVPDPSTTKVRAFGTAGMRLLSEMEQVPIWSAVEAAITASGFEFAAAHTIAGGYEGLFNWLTNKYVLQTTLGKDVFLGCLDYGGASFQVTFAPASGVIQDFGYRLRVDSSQERVYSYSYMRSGQDQAMLRYAKALASRSQESPILDSPCHNQGFNFSMNVAGAGERTLRGTGD